MYLYHYTQTSNISSIIEKGLVYGFFEDEEADVHYGYGTGPINYVLNQHRPAHLPSFINRNECLFFESACTYNDFGHWELKVDSNRLNAERLFVADSRYAQQIWDGTVHAGFSGEELEIPLAESAQRYWESLRPYHQFLQENHSPNKVEVLYFGKIPFSQLELGVTLEPTAQRIFYYMSKDFRVNRFSSTFGEIFTSEKQFFQLFYERNQNVLFLSKTGYIDEKAVEQFETHFLYKEKNVTKNGFEINIQYEGIQKNV